MTLEEFKEIVKARRPLDTEEIHQFMDQMSNEARKLTFRLNAAYRTPEEVRALLSELFGRPVPETFRVFPPSPVAIFRIMEASRWVTDARSGTMWCLPH